MAAVANTGDQSDCDCDRMGLAELLFTSASIATTTTTTDAPTGNRWIVLRTTVDVTHMGPATNADLGNEREGGRDEMRGERKQRTLAACCLTNLFRSVARTAGSQSRGYFRVKGSKRGRRISERGGRVSTTANETNNVRCHRHRKTHP